jgi:hypothetical protein
MKRLPSVVENPDNNNEEDGVLWRYTNKSGDRLCVSRDHFDLYIGQAHRTIKLSDVENIAIGNDWKSNEDDRKIVFSTANFDETFVADTTHGHYVDAITIVRQLRRILVASKRV